MFFNKRTLIYTAFGNTEYLQIVGKLANAGIKYTTKSRSNNLIRGGHDLFSSFSIDKSIPYDIYVDKKDKHIALQAIHKN